jgi:hypothetical protein
MNKFVPLASGLAYAIMLNGPAYSADLINERIADASCAVSAPNTKIEVAGGKFDDNGNDSDERAHIAGS